MIGPMGVSRMEEGVMVSALVEQEQAPGRYERWCTLPFPWIHTGGVFGWLQGLDCTE
jgi:hypothetical protein